MKLLPVVWRPAAQRDLLALYDWIAQRADPETAFAYTSRIEAYADTLATFPDRGTSRDDLVAGLRTVVYRRRTVIAYRALDGCVEIAALFRAGQDWDSVAWEEEGDHGLDDIKA